MHTHSHWYACMILTHSLTHFPSHTQRLPSGYRDLIEFFSCNPGLVKWTGTALLLYFNAGSLDALGSDHHASAVEESDDDRDDTVDRGGQTDETKRRCTVMWSMSRITISPRTCAPYHWEQNIVEPCKYFVCVIWTQWHWSYFLLLNRQRRHKPETSIHVLTWQM